MSAAWNENRILEKYFAPVLDTPMAREPGATGGLPQRADAETRAAAAPTVGPYVSAAYPNALYPWRQGVFWTAVLALAAVLPALGVARRTR